jgi:hypothetical protein
VPLQYQLEEADGMLLLKVTGEWDVDSMRGVIDAIAVECDQHRCHRVLLDGLALEIAGKVLEFERFLVGQHIAAVLRHVRLAALFPAEQINRFAESIAVKGGAEFFVSSDRDEAIRWLAKGSPDAAGAGSPE